MFRKSLCRFVATLTVVVGLSLTGACHVHAESPLDVKKKSLENVTTAKENLTIYGDLIRWKDEKWLGPNLLAWPINWKREFVRRYRQFTPSPPVHVPWDAVRTLYGNDLDDEVLAAHRALATQGIVKVASLLVELGNLTSLIGSDAPELAVALVQMIVDELKKPDKVDADNASDLLRKYSPDIDKLSEASKIALARRIQQQLSAEISKELKSASPKGPQATSHSNASVRYTVGSGGGTLSFSGDYVSNFLPDTYVDPVMVGAVIRVTDYSYQGLTMWGGGLPLFTPKDTDAYVSIEQTSGRLLVAELPSLVYLAEENTFRGVVPFVLAEGSESPFAIDMVDMLSYSWGAALGQYLVLDFQPFSDFAAATQGFNSSSGGDLGFTNRIGFLQVPEPSTLGLMLAALGALCLGCRRNV